MVFKKNKDADVLPVIQKQEVDPDDTDADTQESDDHTNNENNKSNKKAKDKKYWIIGTILVILLIGTTAWVIADSLKLKASRSSSNNLRSGATGEGGKDVFKGIVNRSIDPKDSEDSEDNNHVHEHLTPDDLRASKEEEEEAKVQENMEPENEAVITTAASGVETRVEPTKASEEEIQSIAPEDLQDENEYLTPVEFGTVTKENVEEAQKQEEEIAFPLDGEFILPTAENEAEVIDEPTEPDEEQPYWSPNVKNEWPELVSTPASEAKVAILSETNHGVQVFVVPEGSFVTMDYRMDRVRLWVDDNNMVVSVPTLG